MITKKNTFEDVFLEDKLYNQLKQMILRTNFKHDQHYDYKIKRKIILKFGNQSTLITTII